MDEPVLVLLSLSCVHFSTGLAVAILALRRSLQCLTAAGVEPRCILGDSFPFIEQTHLHVGRERSDCVTACQAFALGTEEPNTLFFPLFLVSDFFLKSAAAS